MLSSTILKNSLELYTHQKLIDLFKLKIPQLTSTLHKGQCGRVCVVGGSQNYTGAPYYSSISSLKSGCDLCYIISTKDSSNIIKSYSPELIVLPLLQIDLILNKIHSIIIGPGLSRDNKIWSNTKLILNKANKLKLNIIIDADALIMLQNDDLNMINNSNCILTPNKMEFINLYNKIMNKEYKQQETIDQELLLIKELSNKLNDNITIIKKGQNDIIFDKYNVLINKTNGSNRRCGGQGDLLNGFLGTFMYWSNRQIKDVKEEEEEGYYERDVKLNGNLIAAYAATTLLRELSNYAFNKYHRSMLTTNLIDNIHNIFYNLFES